MNISRNSLLVRGALLIAGVALYFAVDNFAFAQTPNEDILRALQSQQQNQNDETVPETAPTVQTYQPAASGGKAPGSRLEDLYSARAGRPLTQFGYDILGVPTAVQVGQVGAVQDSYVLGQGDEIVVVFRGQENATYRQRVNRDGQIILPKLNPVSAEGRSFGDFRAELEAQVHQVYLSTNVFVTLGEARQVSVLVTGQVRQPGARILSALASPLDAILLSGGIDKTGSLRAITLIRGGTSRTIDLYSVLLAGKTTLLGNLRDGDRIYVPPLGRTIAIAGLVRKPGIYELPAGVSAMSSSALIAFAGGVEIAGEYQLSKMALGRAGGTELIPSSGGAAVRDGEILFVDARSTASVNHVMFAGALQSAGTYPYSSAKSVGRVVRSPRDVTPDGYLAFSLISRRDPQTNARVLVPFALEGVLAGHDVPLEDNDVVYILTISEVRALANATTAAPGSALIGEMSRADLRAAAAAAATAGATGNAAPPSTEQFVIPSPPPVAVSTTIANALQVSEPALTRTAAEHTVSILDQVRDPGTYLMADDVSLRTLVKVAGGVLETADLSWVEVTSTKIDQMTGQSHTERTAYKGREDDFEKVALHPRDVVRFRQVFSDLEVGQISVSGEVRYPGTFSITRGEHLSSILERAGGLTDQAYAYGAVFTRQRAAVAEREGNERNARTLESEIVTLATLPAGATAGGSATDNRSSEVSFLQSIVGRLRSQPVVGRIATTVDPAQLRANPELDIVVEPGDALFIPKQPTTVTVSGEVLSSGSFQYKSGFNVRDYVALAGGTTADADSGRIFVVMPDGSARPASESWFSFGSGGVPPGATIVVPRDLRPFDTMAFVKDIAQILSQLAITAASLTVISR